MKSKSLRHSDMLSFVILAQRVPCRVDASPPKGQYQTGLPESALRHAEAEAARKLVVEVESRRRAVRRRWTVLIVSTVVVLGTVLGIYLRPQYYVSLGDRYWESGDYRSAITCYQSSIEIDPTYVEAYNNLGTAHANLKQYAEVLHCNRGALSIDSSYALSYYNMCYGYFELSEYVQSISCYARYTFLNPVDAVVAPYKIAFYPTLP